MILFLIFSIPLAFLIYIRIFFPESFTRSETWQVFLRGLVSFLISVLPLYIIIRSYPKRYAGSALYLRSFFLDFFIILLPLTLFFILWEKRKIKYEYGQRLYFHILTFTAGFSVLSGVFYGFVYFGFYSGYLLFGYPLLLMQLMIGTVVLLYMYVITMDWKRYIFIVLPFAAALLYAVVPLLTQLSYTAYGISLCLLYTGLTALSLFVLQRKRIIPHT